MRLLGADAHEHRVELGVRQAEADVGARRGHRVRVARAVERARRAVVDVERARDAVVREVRVGLADRQVLVGVGRAHVERDVVARTEHVLLLDRARQRDLVGLRVAGGQRQVAGGLLDDVDGQVDLVGRAGHVVGVDVHAAEEAEAVDAVARQLDLGAVVPGRFELAELAADHFVARDRVARQVDAAHVGAAARVGGEHDHDLARLAVDLGMRLDVRERVAVGAEQVGERARGGGDVVAVVFGARLELDQVLELRLAPEVVAFEADRR